MKKKKLPSYYSGRISNVEQRNLKFFWDILFLMENGRANWGINDAICQMYYAKSRLARLVYCILTDKIKKSEGKGKPDLNLLFIYNMPFRGIAKMTGGAASMEMARGIVDMVNGKWLSGTKRVIKGYFRNNKENKNMKNSWKVRRRENEIRKRRIKSWIDKHPAAWEFILFNVLSNVATFVNFIAMWICTAFLFTSLEEIPFVFRFPLYSGRK